MKGDGRMYRKTIKKGYPAWGYHGNFECENPDCPHGRDKTFPPSKMWFSLWRPSAFDNRFSEVKGYCSRACLEEAEKDLPGVNGEFN